MELSKGMREFAAKHNRSFNDPKLRALYEYDLSARRDRAAIAYTAEMRGEARGFARGLAKAHTAMIQKMLDKGLPVDLIYKYVDAPRSEIDAIIAKIRADDRA